MEAIIRIVLRRREGDIYQGELDSIFDLRIWTVWENTVGIYINDEQICVGDMLFDGDHIINRLDDVFHLPNLNAIQISKSNISDLSPLAGLEHIETIYIHDAPISDISPLQAMTNVSVLGLLDCPITDISALRGLIEMRRLRLENLAISDLSPLKNMTKLEQLGIVNTDINNLDFLPKIEMMKFLFIHDNANLCDISAIGNIKQIDVLYLDNNKIKDPTPLTKLKRLTHLQIQFNEIEYIAPIAKINGLETAFIFGNPVKDLDEYAGDIRITNEYT